MARVLVVDDEPTLLRSYSRYLGSAGHEVDRASGGQEALRMTREQAYDVVVTDIVMPDLTGLQLMGRVREHDLDVPFVLITGTPTLATAVEAVEKGAYRYVVKPVAPAELREVVGKAARLHGLARLKREALLAFHGGARQLGDRATLERSFGKALEGLWMAWQPIVSSRRERVHAYEALLRTREPSLANPHEFLVAAERLGRVEELGQTIRGRVAESAGRIPRDVLLFVNLHPHDLMDEQLFDPSAPLSALASRVVLEITERASLDHVPDVTARVEALQALGFRTAVDDLGAGYAGLSTLTRLDPCTVKVDMSLVRGIDRDSTRQRIVGSVAQLCHELAMDLVVEGVETEGERRSLVELGCDLLQGYLIGRPAAEAVAPSGSA